MRNGDESAKGARGRGRAGASLLEWALVFTFVAHGAGMVGLVAFLLPGLPGGSADAAGRMAYVAGHPWLWRLGWLGWQITAISDVGLAVALLRTPWIPRVAALVTLALTVAAVVPDQVGQARWITEGVALAERAVRTQDPGDYLPFERSIYRQVGAVAAALYTLGGLGWTWCLMGGGAWDRRLTWLSWPLWTVFVFASVGPLLPGAVRPAPGVVGAANAAGFLMLEVWFLLAFGAVRRRRIRR